VALPIRQQLAQLLHLARHLDALLGEEALDRGAKARIADPVRAVGGRRLLAALQLVRALRAHLDARETALNRELDRLIVAIVWFDVHGPISAAELSATLKEEGILIAPTGRRACAR
jgi:alanine-alpha-ketoisovalerate/valine-pyruvate aminotransferase